MQEQREKKRRNLFSIFVVIGVFVALVVIWFAWRGWEAKHKGELRSFVVSPQPAADSMESSDETPDSKPERELPEEPEALLTMAEEALKDQGYFADGTTTGKGFQVYFLLKKALDCNCDVQKAEALCKRLKECSANSNYGAWFVDRELLEELDEKIKAVKES